MASNTLLERLKGRTMGGSSKLVTASKASSLPVAEQGLVKRFLDKQAPINSSGRHEIPTKTVECIIIESKVLGKRQELGLMWDLQKPVIPSAAPVCGKIQEQVLQSNAGGEHCGCRTLEF